MYCEIIDVQEFVTIVEYITEESLLVRKVIPRVLLPDIHLKGPANLPNGILQQGMEYSNIDLELFLGKFVQTVRIRDLEQALRRAGLWTREDYRSNPEVVERTVKTMRGTVRELDTATVLNAALRPLEV